MSFLSGIQAFSKDKLKKTETHITTTDGRQLLESRDDQGRVTTVLKPGSSLGFVGDYKPDLQVGEVVPGLVMGSQDVAADLDLLKTFKVTHILNVASGVENLYPEKFTYKTVKILDTPETVITTYFEECFGFIEEAKQNGCVLVHCNAGVSRSASIVIGYLMKYEKMDFKEAFEHLKSKRPSIRPNDGFKSQLLSYKP